MDLNLLLMLHLSSVMRSCRHYPHYRPLKDEIPLPYDVRLRQGYNKDEYREATPLHHVKLTSGELMTMSRFAFIVDAQDTSSGTVENDVKFSLQEKPIAYASRSLTLAEKNYSTTEKECLAVIWAISKFRPYIFGKPFTVVTDHHSLCWLANVKDPSGRLARWARLQEYDITIVYKSGRKHSDADSLSRNPLISTSVETCDEITTLASVTEYIKEQLKDPKLKSIIKVLKRGDEYQNYLLKDGVLYKKTFDPMGQQWLLVVPKQLRGDILRSLHDVPTAGHLGFSETYDRIRRKYYWPGLYGSTRRYISH
ncbi:Retrovirus-related Pol polyprotein from transposon 17.6 [Araneus ventricosus]|uniref:RNA-directed DNA polymerase n=1 Tax=Araneus ventricosus TaxID=182803 RepID=A0A4Y2ILD3_ARAVE|nr:Retrovirus-related Pol polyprotein from transposon 17.6 [Araneus ventricosus]